MQYPRAKLGDVCDILDYKRRPITKKDRIPGTIPYYGATGIVDYVKNYIFDEPLVLLGEDGAKWSGGEISAFEISGKTWVNNHAHVLRPHSELYSKWLVQYLNFADLSNYITGVTVPKLNQERMCMIELPLPPLSVQKEIVTRLEKELAKVDKMADGFRSMAELADEEFKSVLSETFEHIEGKSVKLGDVCDCCLGKMLDKSKNKGKLHRYLRNVNVRWGAFDLEDVLEMRFEDDEHERYGLKNGDIVMCEGGEPGRCAIWREEEPGMLFQKALHRIRPSKAFLSEYLYFLFMSYSYNGIFHKRFVGTTIYHLTGQVLKELPVTVCSIENQQLIISNLSLAETHKNSLKKESEHGLSLCSELRKSILQEAFA